MFDPNLGSFRRSSTALFMSPLYVSFRIELSVPSSPVSPKTVSMVSSRFSLVMKDSESW